jgi:hypothetical protein
MIQRAFGQAGRVGVLALCTAVTVLVAATSSSAATSVNVACGDSAALVAAVNTVNAGGGGSINKRLKRMQRARSRQSPTVVPLGAVGTRF